MPMVALISIIRKKAESKVSFNMRAVILSLILSFSVRAPSATIIGNDDRMKTSLTGTHTNTSTALFHKKDKQISTTSFINDDSIIIPSSTSSSKPSYFSSPTLHSIPPSSSTTASLKFKSIPPPALSTIRNEQEEDKLVIDDSSTGPIFSPSLPHIGEGKQEINLIGKNNDNRRFFPQNVDASMRPQGSFAYLPPPDCNSSSPSPPGCIILPQSFKADPPDWAGKIYAKPPLCEEDKNQNSTNRSCDLRIPMSRSTYDLSGELLISINPFDQGVLPTKIDGSITKMTSIIVMADVNNDQYIDAIVGNGKQGNQLLINAGGKGEDIFYAPTNLPGDVTLVTQSIAVADVNYDGLVDIIIGNKGSNNQLLINAGDGNFEDIIDLPGDASSNTKSIAVGDVNNDGMIDIIVGNDGKSNQLLTNIGDGTFEDASDLPAGNGTMMKTYAVAVADVNGDGMVDIIVGNNGHMNELLMNSGGGNFDELLNLPGDSTMKTHSLAVADVNKDGLVDILIGNEGGVNQLLMNNDNKFDRAPIPLPGNSLSGTYSINTADMDNDGMVDILIGNSNFRNQLLMNSGRGTFEVEIDLPGGKDKTYSITAADVDNNGMVDIIVGNDDKGSNQLLMNEIEDVGFEDATNMMPNHSSDDLDTSVMIAADMDNDGLVDILIGNLGQTNQLLVNTGFGKFTSKAFNNPERLTRSIAVADVNNDGLLDIIVGNDKESNELLINKGDRIFHPPIDLPGNPNLATFSVVTADVDNNGMVDIIVGNRKGANQLLMNKGNGTFDTATDLAGNPGLDTFFVIAADVDSDDMVDIIVGNAAFDASGEINSSIQLLMNLGGGNFGNNPIDLSEYDSSLLTNVKCMAVADVNNDGKVDIIIGNTLEGHSDQLLVNIGEGKFDKAIDLPDGGTFETHSIAAADVDDDGLVDIIVGNNRQMNYVLKNKGNSNFEYPKELPGGRLRTYAIAIAEVNSDGLLDILVGNRGQGNQILTHSTCIQGGARLHSKSWCYKCPSFMGRDRSVCEECIPDYVQQEGRGEECTQCPLQQRLFGQNSCLKCPGGTYYNNTLLRLASDPSTWNDRRCEPCSYGEYASEDIAAINKCFECPPGTHQPDSGKGHCLDCRSGEFQTEFGKDHCDLCSTGGYCDAANKLDGGFTPCPPGTYNDKVGQSNETACQLCPSGTYSTISGGNSTDVCLECPSGTYSDHPGQTECKPCEPGTFQESSNQTSCNVCPGGTYADKSGFEECIQCPYRLSSTNGSDTCPFCSKNFYLNDISATRLSIFQNPSKYCFDCPPNALCKTNTTLYDLGIPKNYWRYSRNTSKLYRCEHSTSCTGTTSDKDGMKSLIHNSRSSVGDPLLHDGTGIYCEQGHTGPLCEVCTKKDHYFSITNGQCTKCRLSAVLVVQLLGIFLGVIVVLALFLHLLRRHIPPVLNIILSLSPQAKVKLLVSFYQVLSSLKHVYGVTISPELTNWMNVFEYFTLDFLHDIAGIMPISCIGSINKQLMINTLWPFMVITLGGYFVLVSWMMQQRKLRRQVIDDGKQEAKVLQQDNSNLIFFLKKRTIQWTIIVLYFALPTVSQRVFDAIKCRAFQINDNTPAPTFQSHLLMDMSIICNTQQDDDYGSIKITFWALFTVWIILIPLAFVVLLRSIGPSVRSKSITFLADACRFLWHDYDVSMFFWDIVDTYRKIFLTGAIILIDPEEGSNKMLRLVIAIVVSVIYFAILLAYRPYKRPDDYNLAFLSNFLTICCFSLSMILKLCTNDNDQNDDNDNDGTCNQFIGLSLDSYKASILVVILSMGMLLTTIGFLVMLAINKITAPTVRMVSSGYTPNLELPDDCKFHVFMSHVWATGQAKTHAITRKIQLFLPGLKVWLDVDELKDITKLEESVAESSVFILYYSKGYFQSKNCRREIYAAIYFDKPIILLYEGDDSVLEEMKDECIDNCVGYDGEYDYPRVELILEKLLGSTHPQNQLHDDSHMHGPIQWLNEGSFSAAVLNRIYSRILSNLPYYKIHPNLLEQGIWVPGELGEVSLESPINLLVYRDNDGCWNVAEELKTMLPHKNSALISIHDVNTFLCDDDLSYDSQNEAKMHDLSIHDLRDAPTFLLLYLNVHTFEGIGLQGENEVTAVIQSCIDSGISIVLVNEMDSSKGGCDFGEFFKQTPQELINPPNNLYRDIAIPLYSIEECRIISLRQILSKMGGTVTKSSSRMISGIQSIRNFLTKASSSA